MRILIIRHGDPNYTLDCLTEKGEREATLLAEKLKNEKIDYFYSSPLGRAKQTCEYVARAHGREKDIVVKEWLREFCSGVETPLSRDKACSWDMLPQQWVNEEQLYHYKDWKNHKYYETSYAAKEYDKVIEAFDELLAKHGYVREGNHYRVERPNRDTVAFFCHFGLEGVLMSRLCDISPISIWHHFTALTSSLTTLYTEERREGIALFRCSGFGDIGHLYAGNEPPSFAARFCETFDSDERHD